MNTTKTPRPTREQNRIAVQRGLGKLMFFVWRSGAADYVFPSFDNDTGDIRVLIDGKTFIASLTIRPETKVVKVRYTDGHFSRSPSDAEYAALAAKVTADVEASEDRAAG